MRAQAPQRSDHLGFRVAFAAAALLVAMLVDARLFLVGVITALLLESSHRPECEGTVCDDFVFHSGGIGRYRERPSVTLAGLLVGCINVVMALAGAYAGNR